MTRIVTSLALLGLLSGALVAQEDAQEKKPAKKTEAPDFTLKDLEGNEHSLSDYEDKVVVLEWVNQDCPYVQKHYDPGHMQKLANKWREKDVVWLAVDSTPSHTSEQVAEWAEEKDVEHPILLDRTTKVGRLYKAKRTPHMYILKDGKRLYEGAIDDAPRGEPEVNYVDKALKEIMAGKEVSTKRTRPYGCTVKYTKKKTTDS